MANVQVYDLRCEYKKNPVGLDVRQPRLSWKLQAEERGVLQAAYRLQTAVDEAFESVVWDSGRVESGRSVHVPYEGPELRPRTRYYYRVRIWDASGMESAWSETGFWETALLSETEWRASWIKPPARTEEKEAADYLRREFRLDGEVASARIYATALGVYRLYVNGRTADDTLFAPGWTSYNKRLQYQTYDVTAHLRDGGNAIGVLLGNGWYKGNLAWAGGRDLYGTDRALLLQLHVTYADGREAIVATDGEWTSGTGALRMSELYHGETYDARLEQAGWHEPGFGAEGWMPVETLERGKETLTAQENDPVRIVEQLKPAAVLTTPRGEQVIDLGQNMVGWLRFTVSADAGRIVTLRHAEVLDKEGNFYTGNLRAAKQTISYTCKGGGPETFEPLLSFQGFRYVQVEGVSAEELAAGAVGCVIHTDMEQTGFFRCSDELLNKLQQNIVWGQRGNFLDVPTDCPQRDERLGWTGDAQVFIRTAAFNYGVGPFFTKWLKDLSADQLQDGSVPHIIPAVIEGAGSAAWGDAATICPWTLYECYGDTRVLEAQFPSMKAWVEYIRAQGDNEYLWNTGFHFGDWLGLDAKENSYVGATPKDLIATAFYAHSTGLTAKAAEVLGYEEEAAAYRALREKIVEAFNREFVTPNGRVASPTQTAYAVALMFDLLQESDRERTARMLAQHIEENGVHLTTGFVGTPYLLLVLTRFGYTELAYKLAVQKEYPSWLYSVLQGATTIWEHWDGIKPDGSFWSDDMNSFNHYAYGSIGDWFYRVVAGIDTDLSEEGVGYKRIVVRPQPGEPLTHAEAAFRSMYGDIRSAWKKEGGRMEVSVAIPANTTAEIVLPGAADPAQVLESDAPLADAGISQAERTPDGVRLSVGSGTYRFSYPVPEAAVPVAAE